MKIKRFLLIILCLQVVILGHTESYNIDRQGNVIFERTLENLPLNAAEIHNAAAEYLENAYKDTRYTIIENNPEVCSVTGQGELNNFYQPGGLTRSLLYSLKFNVKVDAKDGRARVRIIYRNYTINELSDIKSDGMKEFLISNCAPLVNEDKNRKHNKKAFEYITEFSQKTLGIVCNVLTSAIPSNASDDAW